MRHLALRDVRGAGYHDTDHASDRIGKGGDAYGEAVQVLTVQGWKHSCVEQFFQVVQVQGGLNARQGLIDWGRAPPTRGAPFLHPGAFVMYRAGPTVNAAIVEQHRAASRNSVEAETLEREIMRQRSVAPYIENWMSRVAQ